MQPDEHVTPVIFKLDHDEKRPFAAFPQTPGTLDPYTMTAYVTVGGHVTASAEYVARCKPASPEQYAPLLAELQRIGYRLQIRRRATSYDLAKRRAEIAR